MENSNKLISPIKIKDLPNEVINLIYDYIYGEFISSDYIKIAKNKFMFRLDINEFFTCYNYNQINIRQAFSDLTNDTYEDYKYDPNNEIYVYSDSDIEEEY